MTLDLGFRRLGLLPGFIQTGNGEPRKAHWLGNRQAAQPGQEQKQSGHEGPPPRRPDRGRYRSLSSITLGEVEDAYDLFRAQLVPSPAEGWLAKNYFCQIPLQRQNEGPPLIFGRVKTVYPSDGHLHNIEELELYFPQAGSAPDVLHLRSYQFFLERPAQTYCIGVKFYVSPEEKADVAQSENIFVEKGFAPLYETGYLDLIDLPAENHPAPPWMHVIGSEWFASIPVSLQPEVRAQLREMVRRGHSILNYHPRRHALRYLSLNEELDFQYGFSEHFLVTLHNTDQTLKKIEGTFGEIFMGGLK